MHHVLMYKYLKLPRMYGTMVNSVVGKTSTWHADVELVGSDRNNRQQ